jgi:N-hydroxyarylamine O-acetyltransferase
MFQNDLYFRRIGYTGPHAATLEVLTAVCTHHTATIVYENIDPLLGTAPQLALPVLQDKLLAQGRGGYCYEQNLLLMHALAALGMQVTPLVARVVWMRPPGEPTRPRSHMLLRVDLAGHDPGPWIADVGFGGNLMSVPLRLEPGLAQRTPHNVMRITRDAEAYSMETQLPTGWTPMYRFTLEAQQPADYEPLNWFTATHPSSIFCHNLLMERLQPELRTSLFNDRLVLRRPGEPPVVRRISAQSEFDQVMAERFGLHLPSTRLSALFERIPKGVDQFVVPAAA